MMITLFGLLLCAFVSESFACEEEKLINSKKIRNPYYTYDQHGRHTLVTTENVTTASTIICHDIYSMKQITFSYEERDYEQYLKILDSNISTLHPLDFSSFPSITKLYLRNQYIKELLPGVFTGLTRIKLIDLSDNELTEVSKGVFNSLHRLEILNLTNNKISKFEMHSLMGLASLEKLFLQKNNLSVVEDGLFETLYHLKHLDVSANPIEKFPFEDLSNIEVLLLNDTALEILDQDMSNFTMKVFNLSESQLTKIDFSYIPVLEQLDLSRNKIESVANCQNIDAVEIILDNNDLEEFDGLFGSVSRFFIRNNKIDVLDEMFSEKRTITYLDFSFNKISKIEKKLFLNMTSLTFLSLQHNSISQIDPILFQNLSSLVTLDLSNNKIEEFKFGVFDSLIQLEILNISSNKLLDLHQYTFTSLTNLQSLYFDNNRISTFEVRDLRSHLPALREVSLDNNFWKCKDLVKISQFFKVHEINMLLGNSYDVENFNGISCSNPKEFAVSNISAISADNLSKTFQKAINEGIQKSKIGEIFNDEFEKSKFVQYFDKDYSQSNFFKYLENYKFVETRSGNANETKVERLVANPESSFVNNKLLVFGVILLCVIVILLLFNVYFLFGYLKKSKTSSIAENVSQLELC